MTILRETLDEREIGSFWVSDIEIYVFIINVETPALYLRCCYIKESSLD